MTRNSVAKIISWNVDNEAVCASAAKMSTTKGNANEIFEKSRNNPQNTDLIKKVLRSGHKSVIEHAVFSIAFWDVSAFVEQFLIECRLASFTVKSRRYVDFSSLGYIIPSDLCGESLMHYREYMDLLFGGYKVLLEMGIPKEDARFLLPYSFCSNFYCTLNARELANLISSIKYGRGKNIPELQNLAQQLIEQISDIFPALLPEFDCESNTTCDNNDTIWFASNKSIEHIESNEIGVESNLDRHLCQFFCHFTAEQHTPCFLYFYIHGGLRSGGGNQNTEFFVCYVFQIQHRIHPFLYFGAEILYSNGAFSGSNAATFSGFAKSTLAAMRRV